MMREEMKDQKIREIGGNNATDHGQTAFAVTSTWLKRQELPPSRSILRTITKLSPLELYLCRMEINILSPEISRDYYESIFSVQKS
jgi:hypothetical protein